MILHLCHVQAGSGPPKSSARQERSSVPSADSPPHAITNPSSVTWVTWSDRPARPDPPCSELLLTTGKEGRLQPWSNQLAPRTL